MWNFFSGLGNLFSTFKGALNSLRFWNTTPLFNNYADDVSKLNVIFKNPAVLKVFALQCDLFSLGRIQVIGKDGKPIDDDPALKLLNNPNPMQTGTQFLWDFMMWNMFGTNYCYVDSNIVEKPSNKLYFLESQKIDFPLWLQTNSDKLIFSDAKLKEYKNLDITYRYNDGTTIKIPLDKIQTGFDLTNGIGNWFKSPSRIDALYKIISNSEATLDSDNINIRFAGKFMVAGQADPRNVTSMPMNEFEKKDIEEKMQKEDPVTAVKSMIDIKRFVEDQAKLILTEKYLSAYFLIGSMYGIPRDVLEAYTSSTYENQEKARGAHVSYTLQPKGNDFMRALANRWGYTEAGKTILMTWDHLPFMQVFRKENAEVQKLNSITFANLLNSGVSLAEVNEFIGTDFKSGERNYVKSSEIIKPGSGQTEQPATN